MKCKNTRAQVFRARNTRAQLFSAQKYWGIEQKKLGHRYLVPNILEHNI